MLFTKVMAHLYCGIILYKSGAERVEVDEQLRLAIRAENPAPTFASRMAHRFLGSEERRASYLPKIFFAKLGAESAEGSEGRGRRGSRRVSLVGLQAISES